MRFLGGSAARAYGGSDKLHSILLDLGFYPGERSPHLLVASCTLTCEEQLKKRQRRFRHSAQASITASATGEPSA